MMIKHWPGYKKKLWNICPLSFLKSKLDSYLDGSPNVAGKMVQTYR